jgi:hypothetical protein
MDILETIIGMVVYFLLMSLVATAIVEAISNIRRSRGKVLWQVVQTCVGGEDEMVSKIYEHPLIRSLYDPDRTKNNKIRYPSEIPPDSFSRAFLECTIGCPLEEAGDLGSIFYFKSANQSTFPQALKVIRPLVLAAKGEPAATLALIEEMFAKTNERAAGWYKSKVSIYLFLVGLALSVVTNGDASRVFSRLTDSPALRESMLEVVKNIDSLDPSSGKKNEDLKEQRFELVQQISGGWSGDPIFQEGCKPVITISKQTFCSLWIQKFFGLLLTAIAVSLGAPFWYKTLENLLQLRGGLKRIIGKENREDVEKTDSPARDVKEITLALTAMNAGIPMASMQPNRESLALFTELSRYAMLAYESESVICQTLQTAGDEKVSLLKFFSKRSPLPFRIKDKDLLLLVDTQVCIIQASSRIVVAFRGTEPSVWQDVLTDAAAFTKKVDWLGTTAEKAHQGFLEALESVWEDLSSELSKLYRDNATLSLPVYFCGHSLGGALAVLAAARFLGDKDLSDPDDIHSRNKVFGGVHTIGQPRVGNSDFVRRMESLFCGRYTRAVNHRDIVPHLPPPGEHYTHFGILHYLDSRDALWINPSWALRLYDFGFTKDMIKKLLQETVGDHFSQRYLNIYNKILKGAA